MSPCRRPATDLARVRSAVAAEAGAEHRFGHRCYGPALAQPLDSIFARLRDLYRAHEGCCVVEHDEPGRYYLGTREVREKDGYRTQFGGVEIKKAYVSAHLMPVYTHPDMLDTISSGLKQRMQGKSCFNSKKVDEALFEELQHLIAAGVERFTQDGRL